MHRSERKPSRSVSLAVAYEEGVIDHKTFEGTFGLKEVKREATS